MIQTVLFGIGGLVLLIVWSKFWQWTYIDSSKDKLYDLKSEVRSYFMNRGMPFSHPIYQALTNLIDTQISYVSHFTVGTLLTWTFIEDPKVLTRVRDEISKMFTSDDAALTEFTDRVRSQAISILIVHVFETSVFLMFFAVIISVIIGLKSIVRDMRVSLDAFRRQFFGAARKINELLFLDEEYIEDLAYSRGKRAIAGESGTPV